MKESGREALKRFIITVLTAAITAITSVLGLGAM